MATLLPDPDETDRVLISLAAAAYKHAIEQLRAAAAILDAGIWSIAFSNAALALEETGKVLLCVSLLVQPDEKRQAESEAFRAAINSHEAKAFCAYFVLLAVAEDVPESVNHLFKRALRDARRTSKNKMRGFYTDSNATGHVLKPSDITEEQARQMVHVVESALALSAEAGEALAKPDEYLDLVRRMRETDAYASMWSPTDEEAEKVIASMRVLAQDEVDVKEAVRGTLFSSLIDQLLEDEADASLDEPIDGVPAPATTGQTSMA
ncbi:AbiV family abortive infection protein [Streptomyces sp. NPDC055051]